MLGSFYRPAGALICLALGVAACSDEGPTALNADPPSFDVADAVSGYKSGFYWLPPITKAPSPARSFDPALSPIVEVCQLEAGGCGGVVATYSLVDGPNGEVVRVSLEEEHYQVNWHTSEFGLSTTALYRISVRAGQHHVLLGYADVQPVDNGQGLKNIDTSEYIGLVDGRTLPIKFRIETGIVGQVEVQPSEAEAEPGDVKQFTAILTDLHGNPMSTDVTWASSDQNVAIVDQTGRATAVADGTATISATAERVTGSATLHVAGGVIVAVVNGANHRCVLDAQSKAYCWGQGDRGQLGNGTNTSRLTPTAVAGGLSFEAITVGRLHSCAIAAGGKAYCWGEGHDFRLGTGSQVSRSVPTAVVGNLSFVSITIGDSHACGITIESQAWCWGSNQFGESGNGSLFVIANPLPVPGNLLFAAIDGGRFHTCAVTPAGQAFCWGIGSSGTLGNGQTATRSTPQAVLGGHTFSTISAGDSYSCAVTTSGEAYCWGAGVFGRLGNGGTASSMVPAAVSGGLRFTSISAGAGHTCGITTDGQAYCWGLGGNGQLGNGSLIGSSTPVPVSGGITFTSISAAQETTCALSTEGTTYCWGKGYLGNGVFSNSPIPLPLAITVTGH